MDTCPACGSPEESHMLYKDGKCPVVVVPLEDIHIRRGILIRQAAYTSTALMVSVRCLHRRPCWHRLVEPAEILFQPLFSIVRWAKQPTVSRRHFWREAVAAPWRLLLFLAGRTDEAHLFRVEVPREE